MSLFYLSVSSFYSFSPQRMRGSHLTDMNHFTLSQQQCCYSVLIKVLYIYQIAEIIAGMQGLRLQLYFMVDPQTADYVVNVCRHLEMIHNCQGFIHTSVSSIHSCLQSEIQRLTECDKNIHSFTHTNPVLYDYFTVLRLTLVRCRGKE